MTAAAIVILVAGPAPALTWAQDRPPAARQSLLELAWVLGQSHALTQACAPEDQTWRARMTRLIAVETPDQAFEARLAEQFNAGFAAARQSFPTCAPASKAEAAKVAKRGQELSAALSRTP
nr:TIGR02301 family protein [Caulobacter sp. 17J80-11]